MLGPETDGLVITPDGQFMVASTGTAQLQNQVCTYTIDPNTGAPSGARLGGKQVTPVSCLTALGFLSAVAISPDGTLVAAIAGGAVFMFRLANGMLSQIAGSPFSSPMPLSLVSFTRDGKFLLVAGYSEETVEPSHQVAIFKVDSTSGTLTTAPGSPFILSAKPARIVP
jgi:6-phosphogluconolactonase (cycloisomerase 2 family)